MLEILGYIGAVFIGITLGLIGSGGSILTVPVLVYLLGTEPVPATAYSSRLVIFSMTSQIEKMINYSNTQFFQYCLYIGVYFGS